jgi:two-component system, LytTR family, response regulator
MINAIIVEDESHLADYLKELILKINDNIHIIGTYPDVSPAVRAVEQYQPQLIFLDIMLPEGSGFDLLDAIQDRQAEVIFISTYDSFWQEAFNYAAVGYVLKPVNETDLETAIANAGKRISAGMVGQLSGILEKVSQKQQERINKLAIPTEEGYHFVNLDHIVRLESNNAYTSVFMTDGSKTLCSYNIGEFRKILPENEFIQVHKSHIVSSRQVLRFNMRESLIEMTDKSSVPVSRRNKSDFMDHFFIPRRQ